MPFCPVCKYEYNAWATNCPDCNVDLVAELPREPPVELSDEALVPIYFVRNWIEANIVKAVLDASDIPVLVKSDVIRYWKSVTSGPLAEEVLLVPESRAEEARTAIRLAQANGTLDDSTVS